MGQHGPGGSRTQGWASGAARAVLRAPHAVAQADGVSRYLHPHVSPPVALPPQQARRCLPGLFEERPVWGATRMSDTKPSKKWANRPLNLQRFEYRRSRVTHS